MVPRRSALASLEHGVALHSGLPHRLAAEQSCRLEALDLAQQTGERRETRSLDALRDYVDEATRDSCENTYFEVDPASALGLPQA